jgi:hypothetical protein
MDHGIRLCGAAPEAVQILQRSTMDFGARCGQGLRSFFRASKAKHLMPAGDQFLRDADPTQPVAPVTNTRMSKVSRVALETNVCPGPILVK